GLLRWDRFTGHEARALSRTLAAWSRSAPHPIPFWLSTDHEGGATFTQRRYGLAPFPGNMALGAADSADLARRDAEETARELRALGITVTFAPALDVNSDPLNPIIGLRSFGQDPARVARLGAAAVRGYRAGGVLAAVKHFPGHGDTEQDSHLGLPHNDKSLADLEKTELVPFRAALKAGAEAVMPAHMVFPALGTEPGRPVTLSSAALDGFLRGTLGFRGLVFSDSLDMGAIAGVYGSSEAAVLSLLAGNDVLLLGKGDFPAAYAAVLDAARSGRVPRARLEASVARVLDAKRRLGLFDGRPVAPGLADAGLARGRALAKATAEAAVTMVRNDGLLPLRLKPEQELALVVVRSTRYADEAARFAAAVARRHPRTVFVDIPAVAPSAAAVEDAVAQARGAAAVVVGTWQYGGPTPESQAELVRRLVAGPAPVAAVSLMNPYDLSVSSRAGAALAAYGMTDSSLDAAAALLFGEIPARGRLPVAVPGLPLPRR
ncbi:MAG: glycoside hydrolase family 3 C-terminal domain-containing protein, partial [Elusimicrobia bacterium]|nr:glycoside hydrolase family 3 C-terminal domain-containing protein [Elusimicrobiota bacterium]